MSETKKLEDELYCQNADNSDRGGKPTKKKKLGRVATAIGAALLGMLPLMNCAKQEPPEPPQPTYVKIYATTNATYTLGEGPASGTVRYSGYSNDFDASNKPYYKKFDVTAQLGEQAYLGAMPEKQSAIFDIEITADDALKRVFLKVEMSGTKVYNTDVLKLSGFNYDGLYQWIECFQIYGDHEPLVNKRWNQRKMIVYFNPDTGVGGTGKRLPQDFIDITKETVNKIKASSEGYIQTVEFHEDGDKIHDPTVPPDGEIWVFCDTGIRSVGNISYPTNGNVVNSAKTMYNPSGTLAGMAEEETLDAIYNDNQNSKWEDRNYIYSKWLRYIFKRPAGGTFRFYHKWEQQEGFSGSVQDLGQARVQLYPDIPNIEIIPNIFGNREKGYIKKEIYEQPERQRVKR